MLRFQTFFKNHFDNLSIGKAKYLQLAKSHLHRLIRKNVNNLYDERIAILRAAVEAFENAIKEEDVSFALQRANTKRTNDLIATFKQNVQQKEGIIKGTWSVNSPIYMEFFPQGLTEYTKATKGNVSILINRMAEKAQKYAADLPPNFVNLFTEIADSYELVRAEQLSSIGDVAADKTLVHETRFALSQVLMQNLLFVAFHHVGDADGGMDFFE